MEQIKVVEMQSAMDFRIHGNLSRTFTNQLRAKIGNHSTVCISPDFRSGTAQDSKGKNWDWHMNDFGDVVAYPAV